MGVVVVVVLVLWMVLCSHNRPGGIFTLAVLTWVPCCSKNHKLPTFLPAGSKLSEIAAIYTMFRNKVVHFVFEYNFTTTSSIFLQLSVTVTE